MPSGHYPRTKKMYDSRKGRPAWNKGKKFPLLSNENSKHWKGDKVGYSGIHRWLYRIFGKAKKCDDCQTEKNVQWANQSGRYKREREDWKQLCGKCHWHFDRERNYKNKFEKDTKRKFRKK